MCICIKIQSEKSPRLFIENPTSVRCSVSLMVTVLMATGLLSASQSLGVDQRLHSPLFSLRDRTWSRGGCWDGHTNILRTTGAKGHGLIKGQDLTGHHW